MIDERQRDIEWQKENIPALFMIRQRRIEVCRLIQNLDAEDYDLAIAERVLSGAAI